MPNNTLDNHALEKRNVMVFLGRDRPLRRRRSDFYSIFSAFTEDENEGMPGEIEPQKPEGWIMQKTEEERRMAMKLKERMDSLVDEQEEQAVASSSYLSSV